MKTREMPYKCIGLSANGNFIIGNSKGDHVCYVADVDMGVLVIKALTRLHKQEQRKK